MSKWLMQGHFGHLHFENFLMILRTPQCEVFWPLQSSSEFLGVPEDSKSPTLGVWVSSSHLAKVGLRQKEKLEVKLAIWFLNTKNQESPWFLCVTYHWKALDEGYNFAWNLTSIGGLHTKLWAPKVTRILILGILGLPSLIWESRDKMRFEY
jgi:hypothetical protein